jgi:hypothetical protein
MLWILLKTDETAGALEKNSGKNSGDSHFCTNAISCQSARIGRFN